MKLITNASFLLLILIHSFELKGQADSVLYPLGEKKDFRGIEFRIAREYFPRKLIKCSWNGSKDFFEDCVENDNMKIGNYSVDGIYYHFGILDGKEVFKEVEILLSKKNVEGVLKFITSQYGEGKKNEVDGSYFDSYFWKGKYISISFSKSDPMILIYDNELHDTELAKMKQVLKTQDSIRHEFEILHEQDSLNLVKIKTQNGF